MEEDQEATTVRGMMLKGCICQILFRDEPDIVWGRFLRSDFENILSRAVSPIKFSSLKDLYLQLCHPILIDGGRKSFVLEKWTGKKCFMLSARELSITWGDNPQYWTWVSHPDSRFQEVAELVEVCWLDITGRLRTTELSPDTIYVAYLIFKLTEDSYGLDRPEQKASVITRDQHSTKTVCLERGETSSRSQRHSAGNSRAWIMNHDQAQTQTPSTQTEETKHGWLEIVMGEFFNETGSEEEVAVRLFETEHLNWKGGLLIEGIEFRPKK